MHGFPLVCAVAKGTLQTLVQRAKRDVATVNMVTVLRMILPYTPPTASTIFGVISIRN